MVDTMKRKNKCVKRRMFFWFIILALLVSYTGYKAINYWKDIAKNKSEEKDLEDKYNKLLDEEEVLETDLKKQNVEVFYMEELLKQKENTTLLNNLN